MGYDGDGITRVLVRMGVRVHVCMKKGVGRLMFNVLWRVLNMLVDMNERVMGVMGVFMWRLQPPWVDITLQHLFLKTYPEQRTELALL